MNRFAASSWDNKEKEATTTIGGLKRIVTKRTYLITTTLEPPMIATLIPCRTAIGWYNPLPESLVLHFNQAFKNKDRR